MFRGGRASFVFSEARPRGGRCHFVAKEGIAGGAYKTDNREVGVIVVSLIVLLENCSVCSVWKTITSPAEHNP